MKKAFCLKTVSIIAVLACAVTVCSCGNKTAEHTEHDWVLDSASSQAATCGEGGVAEYTCSVCGETKTETLSATGNHSYGSSNVCETCGYIDMSGLTQEEAIAAHGFYHIDADNSNTYSVGDSVLFGSYPQSLVEDAGLLASLGDLQGELPESGNSGDWSSYAYYENGELSDYMFFKDVEYDGNKYRGVYMTKYRPYYSGLPAEADYSYIDDVYELNTVYWFAYMPIEWNVHEFAGGNMFLSAKYCLEGQPYQALYEGGKEDMTIAGSDKLVSDWEASTMRTFLNNDFYNLAFSQTEQALVAQTTLDNKNSGYIVAEEYQKIQNDTQDKVFLLSYKDVTNKEYGFTSDGSRSRTFTAYSTAQGLRPSSQGSTADGDPACTYFLRSAGNGRYMVAVVSKQGTASTSVNIKFEDDGSVSSESYDCFAINGDAGVLPALYLKIK